MRRTQQSFANNSYGPIYVSVEVWPECFELEPGDKLTLVWDAPDDGDAASVNVLNDRELVVEPSGNCDGMKFFINGEPARHRSWVFRHR